jgi:hypothetical protein
LWALKQFKELKSANTQLIANDALAYFYWSMTYSRRFYTNSWKSLRKGLSTLSK